MQGISVCWFYILQLYYSHWLESLGLQGDPTSQRKSVLNIHWKDWCWSWNSNTLALQCEEPAIWKDPDAGKDWRRERKRTTEDEIVGWHQWCNGHEFDYTLGVGDGQGILACYSPLGRKELDTTEQLNWNTHEELSFSKRSDDMNLIYFIVHLTLN